MGTISLLCPRWQDGWTGAAVTGPKTIEVAPTESAGKFNIPLWHKRGGLLVAVQDGELRIGDQDWSELIVEGFPSAAASHESREVFEQDSSGLPDETSTTVALHTDGAGMVRVGVGASVVSRSWLVRLHLRVGERLVLPETALAANGGAVIGELRHLHPRPECSDAGAVAAEDFFPFGGEGTAPACLAGPIAEFRVVASSAARHVEATLARE